MGGRSLRTVYVLFLRSFLCTVCFFSSPIQIVANRAYTHLRSRVTIKEEMGLGICERMENTVFREMYAELS